MFKSFCIRVNALWPANPKEQQRLIQPNTSGWSAAVQFCWKTKRWLWTKLWSGADTNLTDQSGRAQSTLWICQSTSNQIYMFVYFDTRICPTNILFLELPCSSIRSSVRLSNWWNLPHRIESMCVRHNQSWVTRPVWTCSKIFECIQKILNRIKNILNEQKDWAIV